MDPKIKESIEHTWDVESKEIERLKETIDKEAVEEIIRKISACKGKIILTGCGTSAMAAKKDRSFPQRHRYPCPFPQSK